MPLSNALALVETRRRIARGLRLIPFDLLYGRRAGRVSLEAGIRYDPAMDLELDRGVWLSRNGSFQGTGRVRIGSGTYIGSNFSIHCVAAITIGAQCNFANSVALVDNDHGMALGEPMMYQPMRARPIHIENDCWVGEKAIVLSGVTIGTGAVVAAGALVRADVPPRCIVAGVPARVIRERT